MHLEYKPDFIAAQRRWEAFWNGEIIDRPCCRIVAPKDGARGYPHPTGLQHPGMDLRAHVEAYDRWAGDVYFGGEAMPFFFPNFGPDVYSAFVGADLTGFEHGTGTSWAVPFVDDWASVTEQLERPRGYWWQAAIDYANTAREVAEGKFGIGVLDLHSNLDCLAAIRGPQNLCLDLADRPDDVGRALDAVRRSYQPIYDGLYAASGQDKTGTSSWLPFYCQGKFACIQCDFICMISPVLAKRFLYPALEEETQFLDRCCYHLDGPDALVHLDDLLAIEGIDAIQWVPGSGNAPHIEWMDVLKRIQAKGKALYVGASIEEVPVYHKELRPEKTFYDVWAPSQAEAEKLLDWLGANT